MMNFNPWAVLVAAASSFLLGGLWYGKALFGPAWGRASGITATTTKKHGHPARVFGISFLFSLIAAAFFAHRLGPNPDLAICLKSGLYVGAGWVAMCFGINYQFADRSPVLWLIDAGYHTVQFVLFGLVLGLWH
jgi:hypothetical protein